jgi:hypothetical protein
MKNGLRNYNFVLYSAMGKLFRKSANVTVVHSPKRDAIYIYSTPEFITVVCKHPPSSDEEISERWAKL